MARSSPDAGGGGAHGSAYPTGARAVVNRRVLDGLESRLQPVLPAKAGTPTHRSRCDRALIGKRRKRLADRVQDAALGLGQGGWQDRAGGEVMAAASEKFRDAGDVHPLAGPEAYLNTSVELFQEKQSDLDAQDRARAVHHIFGVLRYGSGRRIVG